MRWMLAPHFHLPFKFLRHPIGDVGDGGGGVEPTPTPISLSDDSLFIPPGADKPVKFKDWHSGYVPKGDFEKRESEWNAKREQATNTLLAEARRVEQMAAAQQRQNANRGGNAQSQTTDPLAAIRNQPFVDGQTLHDLYQRMQTEGIGPLQQFIAKMAQQQQALNARLQQVDQRVSSYDRQQDSAKLDSWATSTLEQTGFDTKNPLLRKMLDNYYYSYEPGDGQSRDVLYTEIPTMFAEDMTALRKIFREMDRAEAKKASEARLPSRGGGVTPSGTRKYQFQSARDIAKQLKDQGVFDRQNADT